MKYYKTELHKEAIKATNKRDYSRALYLYVGALHYLENYALHNPRVKNPSAFQDAYAATMLDIMENAAWLMNQFMEKCDTCSSMDILNGIIKLGDQIATINKYFKLFTSYLPKKNTWKITSKARVKSSLQNIAAILDIFSDLCADDKADFYSDYKITLLKNAALALQLAIYILEVVPDKDQAITKHLALFMNLETLYRSTGDIAFLVQIDEQIKCFNLTEKQLTPAEELELLCSAVLVDTKLHQASNLDLLQRGINLIESHPDIGEAGISDFEKVEEELLLSLEREQPPLPVPSSSQLIDDASFNTDDDENLAEYSGDFESEGLQLQQDDSETYDDILSFCPSSSSHSHDLSDDAELRPIIPIPVRANSLHVHSLFTRSDKSTPTNEKATRFSFQTTQ